MTNTTIAIIAISAIIATSITGMAITIGIVFGIICGAARVTGVIADTNAPIIAIINVHATDISHLLSIPTVTASRYCLIDQASR